MNEEESSFFDAPNKDGQEKGIEQIEVRARSDIHRWAGAPTKFPEGLRHDSNAGENFEKCNDPLGSYTAHELRPSLWPRYSAPQWGRRTLTSTCNVFSAITFSGVTPHFLSI